jgi:hypothetical protein
VQTVLSSLSVTGYSEFNLQSKNSTFTGFG